ncbi:MAG: hypothetical protein E7534_04555 [Ruminococcaceae bacterium]|nr:hypothetical protein [Oscillospiraceae bacterium]MBQ2779942.1 septum formation initiator family protein [Clostridia bacterium]MBQ7302326.1 septum formation initiator family protein [Clostridia bacterium]
MKSRRKKKNILLRIAVVAFSIYVIVTLVQLRLEINRMETEEVDVLKDKIAEQKRANENLRRQTENLEEYLEQQAREQGWALPGEVILMEIPGIDS